MEYLGDKPLNVLIPAALFVLLTPGVLLTVTGLSMPYFDLQMPSQSVLIHGLVFIALYAYLRKSFPQYY